MPVDIRVKIALLVTSGEHTDDAYCLAYISRDQRHAVLASLPSSATYELNNLQMSHEWAALLVEHVREIRILTGGPHNVIPKGLFWSPLLRLLREPNLKDVELPGFDDFLYALRNTNSLTALSVHMRGVSRYTLFTCSRKGDRSCRGWSSFAMSLRSRRGVGQDLGAQ